MVSILSAIFHLQTVKSCYLHYLYGLNYWDTNAIFICIIFLTLFNKINLLPCVLLLNFFVKLKFFNVLFLKKQLPEALLIGTITVHPLMFYFFMLILFVKTIKFNVKYLYNYLPISNTRLSLYLTITLILGGFWGLQSTIWGYFWVNDSVEWILLLAILGILYSLHTSIVSTLKFNGFLLIFLLFNLVIMVRLNIFQTRHSFIEQRSLSSFLLCGYLLFFESISRNPFLNKKPSTRQIRMPGAIAFLVFIGSALLAGLLFAKTCFIGSGAFFLRYLYPKTMGHRAVLHALIFTFFFMWGTYFTFFYITYQKITHVPLDLPYLFTDSISFVKIFFLKTLKLSYWSRYTFWFQMKLKETSQLFLVPQFLF